MTTRAALTLSIFLAVACGDYVSAPLPKDKTPTASGVLPSTFDVNMQTPGLFRDMYRMLVAQAQVDDATAVERMKVDLPRRLETLDSLPLMEPLDRASVEGLIILGVRSMQATEASARVARTIGERMIGLLLALDPARVAWNDSHGDDEQVEVARGGAQLLASGASFALNYAGGSAGTLCTLPQAVSGAQWNPGQPQQVWVPEQCAGDRVVPGYCEPDRWIEGECYETWVDEDCSGDYVDRGRYEYRCYGSNDCRTVWVSRWVYEDNGCSGGYWEEDCYPDRFEPGLCYPDRLEPGYCTPGHYETRYTGGGWTFQQYATAPECVTIRPAQGAIAVSAVQVLRGKVYEDIPSEWQAALDELATSGQMFSPDEATIAAMRQILEALQ